MDAILACARACAASASERVRRESWNESQKKLFFALAISRLETLATQANAI